MFEDGDQADQVWDLVLLPVTPASTDVGKGVWACADRYTYNNGGGFRRFLHGTIVSVKDSRKNAGAPAPSAKAAIAAAAAAAMLGQTQAKVR